MTRLTFIGERNGREISVTWQNGALFGDPEACEWIRYLARVIDGQILGPIGGPYVARKYLRNPYAARWLILSVFPGDVRQEGDLPPRLAPRGAIQ
jgi:hypothetical protein